jgi:hypothetical protein
MRSTSSPRCAGSRHPAKAVSPRARSRTSREPGDSARHPVFSSKRESEVTSRSAEAPPSTGELTWISRRCLTGSQ